MKSNQMSAEKTQCHSERIETNENLAKKMSVQVLNQALSSAKRSVV